MSAIYRCDCLGRGLCRGLEGPSQGPREETNELELMVSLRKSGGIPKNNKNSGGTEDRRCRFRREHSPPPSSSQYLSPHRPPQIALLSFHPNRGKRSGGPCRRSFLTPPPSSLPSASSCIIDGGKALLLLFPDDTVLLKKCVPADQYLGLLDFVLLGCEFGNVVTECVILTL
jgi:hypothetical protein